MKISYNWLKWYVPEIPDAEKTAQAFERHLCEVEAIEKREDGDVVLDLNILPNRAHDLLCHQGVGKELAGMLGLKYNDPSSMYKVPEATATKLEIKIETEKCRRYMGRIVRNITVGPSPQWVVQHLESIGQRSINNIVDATNIVMFDCGNPCHAFDIKKLSGEKIVITNATDGEQFETVGREKIVANLKEVDMVVSDGEKTLAIAGVKGGTNSGISDDTTEIVLEVANFDPTSVRKTARRLNLLSDSAKRFENELSPELAEYAMKELTGLIIEICPEAVFEEVVDSYPSPQEKKNLTFSLARVNKKLGAEISENELEAILKNYGFVYTKNGDDYTVDIPPLRLDLTGEHDITEEIGRIYGYERITPVIPKINFTAKQNDVYLRVQMAREKLLADGYSEVMTYAFTKKGKVEIARGLKGKEFLRTNISDGLKESYEMNRLNAPLLGLDEVKIFEIGSVFPQTEKEEIHVAYADKKGVVEAMLEEFALASSNLQLATSNSNPERLVHTPHHFVMWSMYPFITRDISVWVPEGTDSKILSDLYKECAGELLARQPQVFDSFTKDGNTSIGVRLVFQSHEKTLTDEIIFPIMEKINSMLQEKGFKVR
jgi:phenylalanyl-tRNA synthetase beta chain